LISQMEIDTGKIGLHTFHLDFSDGNR